MKNRDLSTVRKAKLLQKKITAFVISSVALSCFPAVADIYFNAKVMGPVTNIYSVNDKNVTKKITDNSTWRDLEFSLSKTGSIVFSSNREAQAKVDLQKKSEDFNLYLTDVSGNNTKKLTASDDFEVSPKFSPDGSLISYIKIAKPKKELWLMNADGTGAKKIAEGDDFFDVAWSPNGKTIVYSVLVGDINSLMFIDIAKGTSKAGLTSYAPTENVKKEAPKTDFVDAYFVGPAWSNRGAVIAFILHPLNRDKERRLLVMDIASKKTKELSEKGVQPQEPLHWKSDSGSLLYAGLKDYKFFYDEAKRTKVYQGGMHIYISTTEGKTVQLTKGDHLYSKPTYSPDEKNIAFLYADELGGAREVILKTMNADGSNIQERANSIVPTSTLIWR